MIIVLKQNTKPEQLENLEAWIHSMGIETHVSIGKTHTIIGLVGDTSQVDMDLVRALDIVENVKRIQEPFKNANRKFHNEDLVVDIGGVKIGGGNKPILLKRGLANTIEEWLMSAEYIMAGGNENVILCERGIRTFETKTRNTLDLSAIPVLKKLTHLPVIVDPSHALGHSNMVKPMAMAATAAGADGLMIEAHNDPARALCDGAQSLTPEAFDDVAKAVFQIRPFACKYNEA